MDYSEEDNAFSYAMQLVAATPLPAALKTAVELDLLELIKEAGPGAFVSPTELAAQIHAANPDAAGVVLDRILRLLADNDILICRLADGGVERRYGLGPVCKFFTRNECGVSVAPLLLMNQDEVFMKTWYHLKDAVLEGATPFNKAHGMNAFEYPAKDPRFNKVFNQAMYQQSTLIMNKIVDVYIGFEGLKSLVDVGGGIGASLKMILSKYPSIKAINFDLPHVVQDALSHPGVEHIAGDMFVSVPSGDAIFLKCILHDWSDAQCLKILRNCHESLPDYGKVIIAEYILSEIPNKEQSSSSASMGFALDVMMLAYNPGGKERTEKEFQVLAMKSGFKECRKICCAYGVWIMELHK